MPAYAEHRRTIRPRERAFALGAVVVVQLLVGLALLRGLQVNVAPARQLAQRLIDITLAKPPPPPPIEPQRASREHSAPEAAPEKLGGTSGPKPAPALPTIVPAVPAMPTAPPSGAGIGNGAAAGAGSGGGAGGVGLGSGDGGGTDAELISGDISPRDYPKRLGNAGVGGTASVTFTVEGNGRVTGCRVIASSGVPELDGLTCRLIEQRFVFRPATDRAGRAISEEIEWDQEWIPHR